MAELSGIAGPSVIHDIGYQRYGGPRLGRAYAVRSLYSHGLRLTVGLGRSAKAKTFPWMVIGLVVMVATILTVIRTQTGQSVVPYWVFPQNVSLLIILFCAAVAPELVSRDLRSGVLPLYFSRPLRRVDYALAKLAAMVSAVWLLLAGPQLLMFVGGAFSLDGMSGVWSEFVNFTKGLAISGVYAVVFGSLSLLVASLVGRRAVAAAMIVATFLVTTPVYGVMVSLAGDPAGSTAQLAGLVSPMTLVAGVGEWLFGSTEVTNPYGSTYGLVTAGLGLACVLLLLLRYRRVAR